MIAISFLGTTDYIPVHYTLEERPSTSRSEMDKRITQRLTTAEPRKFVQAALVELLPEPLEKMVVLTTPDATLENWEGLQGELRDVSFTSFEQKPIENGRTPAELWEVFEQILLAVPQDAQVLLDITHGFRSLQFVGTLAATFARQVRNAAIFQVKYGAFEALGTPREVAQQKKNGQEVLDAPIWDLTAMIALPAWTEAVMEWRRTGRAEGLAEQSQDYVRALRREQRAQAPRELVELPAGMAHLSELLSLARHEAPGQLARRIRASLSSARKQLEEHPTVQPLRYTLDLLDEELREIESDTESDAWKSASADYLRQELALARWFTRKRRVIEAFSILRELHISCAVRLVLQAGINTLPDGAGKIARYDDDDSRFRTRATQMLEVLCGASQHGRGDGEEWDVIERSLPDVQRQAFKTAVVAVGNTRNKLDHCWLGEHSREKPSRQLFEKHWDQLRVSLAKTEELVNSIVSRKQV